MSEQTTKENLNDQPLRRMNSITRKLHHQILWKKVSLFLSLDLLILFFLFVGWVLDTELRVIGDFSFSNNRSFSSSDGFWGIEYIVTDETGKELKFQRGKTYIAVWDEHITASYSGE